MTDHRSKVRAAAERLKNARTTANTHEIGLALAVSDLIEAHENGLREWARSMGISASYACDIRHGRRKISNAMVERILR